jgi:hypothetical protein
VVNLASADPESLAGSCVVEIGIRQAWPYITFAWSDAGVELDEVRLYIGSTFAVDSADPAPADCEDDDLEQGLLHLLEVLNLTVTRATAEDDATLLLRFDGDRSLRISGTPAAWTTGDVWWFGSN